MNPRRQIQWNQRLARLHVLKDHYVGRCSYDRAHKAHLAIQRVYERWANEVLAAALPSTSAAP